MKKKITHHAKSKRYKKRRWRQTHHVRNPSMNLEQRIYRNQGFLRYKTDDEIMEEVAQIWAEAKKKEKQRYRNVLRFRDPEYVRKKSESIKRRYRTDPIFRAKVQAYEARRRKDPKRKAYLKKYMHEYMQRPKVREVAKLHRIVKEKLPLPDVCEICETKAPTELSHKTHEYSEDVALWQWACRECHKEHDKALRDKKIGKERVDLEEALE
jgi:hypothetical protein